MSFELAIKNGIIVTPGARYRSDIGIQDSRIASIGDSISAATEIDATGQFVLPGGIDAHVHLTSSETPGSSPTRVDDFESGSRAAAIGGVTTIGNMTYPRTGELMSQALERVAAVARDQSIVDFVLHPVLTSPAERQLGDIQRLAELGAVSLKIFMVLPEFDADAVDFIMAMESAGRGGLVTMLHCEDHAVIRYLSRRLIEQGRGGPASYPAARPEISEAIAVRRGLAMAEVAEAPLYVVHVGSGAALEAIVEARKRGQVVFAETRPIYLFFTAGAFDLENGALYVGNPPLRQSNDVERMWDGLRFGDVDCYCSDHAPWMKADKLDPSRDVSTLRPGVSDLGTLMPLLFSEGVLRGRVSIERFVELTSTNAAKIFGLYPRKGAIEVGSDADLVVWDAAQARILGVGDSVGRSDFTLYDGWRVTGWPTTTISRGAVIYANGAVTATPGRGLWVRRERMEATVAADGR